MDQLLCVIPCYNEQATIARVVEHAFRYCSAVIVVDDGSTDSTLKEAVSSGARIIHHAARLGVGAAISTGLRAAIKLKGDMFVTMDGDGQHDPSDIPRVVEPILSGNAELVIGSRLLEGSPGMPLPRLMGNKILSAMASIICKVRVTDSQSGFRAYSRKAVEAVLPVAADYSWASQSLRTICRNGFKLVEIPIKPIYFSARARGAGMRDGAKILFETLKPR